MLTSDLWGVVVGFALFHQSLMWLYFVALAVVVVGIVVYHKAGFASQGPTPGGGPPGTPGGGGGGGGAGGPGGPGEGSPELEDAPLVLSTPTEPVVYSDRAHLLRKDGSPR
jgi:hypothetical protein